MVIELIEKRIKDVIEKMISYNNNPSYQILTLIKI